MTREGNFLCSQVMSPELDEEITPLSPSLDVIEQQKSCWPKRVPISSEVYLAVESERFLGRESK